MTMAQGRLSFLILLALTLLFLALIRKGVLTWSDLVATADG
jgi:hypothetical protein